MYRFLDFADSELPHVVVHQLSSSFGREVLWFNHADPGQTFRVWRDIAVKSFVTTRQDRVPDMRVSAEELLIPRFRIVETGEGLSWHEDVQVLRLVSNAVPAEHTVTADETPSLVQCLATARLLLQEHNLDVDNLICHPRVEDRTLLALHEIGVHPRVIVSRLVPSNTIYLMAPPDHVGVFVDYDDRGFVEEGEFEHIGVGIVNDYACSKVTLV